MYSSSCSLVTVATKGQPFQPEDSFLSEIRDLGKSRFDSVLYDGLDMTPFVLFKLKASGVVLMTVLGTWC